MKKIFALLLTLVLVLSLAACGSEETAVAGQPTPAATQATEASMETIPEATTEPLAVKILEPFFRESPEDSDPDSTQMFECTLELVDDTTVKVNLLHYTLYRKEDVLSLRAGEEVGLRADDQVYWATVVRLQKADAERGTDPAVQLSCSGRDLWLAPETDGKMGDGNLIGFSAVYPPDEFIEACCKSYTADADSFVYWEFVETETGEESALTNLPGMELIQRLKDPSGTFRLEHIRAGVQNGKIVHISAYVYPS